MRLIPLDERIVVEGHPGDRSRPGVAASTPLNPAPKPLLREWGHGSTAGAAKVGLFSARGPRENNGSTVFDVTDEASWDTLEGEAESRKRRWSNAAC